MRAALFVDPFSPDYYEDRLFDPHSPLNRDDCLAPFRILRAELEARGVTTKTADALWQGRERLPARSYLISLGMVRNLRAAKKASTIPLALFLFEPPTVAPRRFLMLPSYGRRVRNVFTLLAPGERWGPLRIPGRQFRYPQPPLAGGGASSGPRDGWLVAVFSAKRAAVRSRELYSERRRAIEFFGRRGELDLFGPGWDGVRPDRGGDSGLRRAWRGPVSDKLRTLSRYRFALCYENSRWRGYVTEKVFDCLRAGTVPIYWGAPDIQDILPPDTYIDRREFASDEDLARYLHAMPEARVNAYREASDAFLRSGAYRPFAPEAFVRLVLDLLAE
jgi:hypothetical protein